MPKIYIKKAFTLQHDGEKHEFAVGNHEVPAAIAAHWFVKAHTGEEPAGGIDAEAEAAERLAELDAKAKALLEAADMLADREKALAEREQAADQRDADLAKREAAVAEREQAADKAAADAAKAVKSSK